MAYTYKTIGNTAATVLSVLAVAGGILWYARSDGLQAPQPQDEAALMHAILEREYATGNTNAQFVNRYGQMNTIGMLPNATYQYPGMVRDALSRSLRLNMVSTNYDDLQDKHITLKWLVPNNTFMETGSWNGDLGRGLASSDFLVNNTNWWANYVTLPTNTVNVNAGKLFAFERDNKQLYWSMDSYSDMSRALSMMQYLGATNRYGRVCYSLRIQLTRVEWVNQPAGTNKPINSLNYYITTGEAGVLECEWYYSWQNVDYNYPYAPVYNIENRYTSLGQTIYFWNTSYVDPIFLYNNTPFTWDSVYAYGTTIDHGQTNAIATANSFYHSLRPDATPAGSTYIYGGIHGGVDVPPGGTISGNNHWIDPFNGSDLGLDLGAALTTITNEWVNNIAKPYCDALAALPQKENLANYVTGVETSYPSGGAYFYFPMAPISVGFTNIKFITPTFPFPYSEVWEDGVVSWSVHVKNFQSLTDYTKFTPVR